MALMHRMGRVEATPPWRNVLLVGWTGMRGAVSLAAALALPLVTDAGADFPNRDLVIFCAFSVIVGTLLIQGLTLPPLIRLLDVDDVNPELEREELIARKRAAQAAIDRVDELAEEDWVREDTAERVRGAYSYRHRRFTARFHDDGDDDYEERAADYQRLLRQVYDAQRSMLIEMRDRGEINDDILRVLERELDLKDSRLEI